MLSYVSDTVIEIPNVLDTDEVQAKPLSWINWAKKIHYKIVSVGFNFTALHQAASLGNVELCQNLLEESAEIDVRDSNNWTPLMIASEKGHIDIVKLLVEKGADIQARSSDNMLNSLIIALGHSGLGGFKLWNLERLSNRDHDVKGRAQNCRSYLEIVEYLYTKGATCNSAKKLLKEFKHLKENPSEEFSVCPSENNIFIWNAVIFGPKRTPFEDGAFKFLITFDAEYPYRPPAVIFNSKMFPSNVKYNPFSHLDILKTNWSPACNVSFILTSIKEATCNAMKILLQDFKYLQENPSEKFSVCPSENNIFIWNAIIFGPKGSLFEDGAFKLLITFDAEYPYRPPAVGFTSEMFHPNVKYNSFNAFDTEVQREST